MSAMRIAACLLTADRPESTLRCLNSVHALGLPEDSLLLHGDDASAGGANCAIAAALGFQTVIRTGRRYEDRRGIITLCRALWSEARRRGATHILHLESDQEFVRDLNLHVIRLAQSVRLYGRLKFRDPGNPRSPAGVHRYGTRERIDWQPTALTGWERGQAHWGGQASITRVDLLLGAIAHARRLSDVSRTLNSLDTLRPVENIVWHQDVEPTPR